MSGARTYTHDLLLPRFWLKKRVSAGGDESFAGITHPVVHMPDPKQPMGAGAWLT